MEKADGSGEERSDSSVGFFLQRTVSSCRDVQKREKEKERERKGKRELAD